MQLHLFVLQAFDPQYGHPAFQSMFAVERLEDLREVLGEAAADDPEVDLCYALDPGDVEAVNRRFGLAFETGDRKAALVKRQTGQEPPYLVHTGYELALMIEGRKPFARFDGMYPPGRFEVEFAGVPLPDGRRGRSAGGPP